MGGVGVWGCDSAPNLANRSGSGGWRAGCPAGRARSLPRRTCPDEREVGDCRLRDRPAPAWDTMRCYVKLYRAERTRALAMRRREPGTGGPAQRVPVPGRELA